MKHMLSVLVAAAPLLGPAAFAQAPGPDQRRAEAPRETHAPVAMKQTHAGAWRKGDHFDHSRVPVSDWHQHRGLWAPPSGYEWVDDNGQFVLIAVSSGIVASIVVQ